MDYYNEIDTIYGAIINNIEKRLFSKYEKIIEEKPMMLLEYLNEVVWVMKNNLSQKFIYPFAKLSLNGHMPLMEEECYWRDRFFSADRKPLFVRDRSSVSSCLIEDYNRNPFTCCGSDFGHFDGAFTIQVQFNDKYPNTFDVVITVDHDITERQFGRKPEDPNGRAFFVFRVSTINNDENVIKVLGYLKDLIISRKVRMDMDKLTDKLVIDIADNLFEKYISTDFG